MKADIRPADAAIVLYIYIWALEYYSGICRTRSRPKRHFPKGFPRKKTPIFKNFPLRGNTLACGASVNAKMFLKKGARAVSVFGWFFARAGREFLFFLGGSLKEKSQHFYEFVSFSWFSWNFMKSWIKADIRPADAAIVFNRSYIYIYMSCWIL